MDKVGNYKQILAVLAIVAIFSTVAPVQVFAGDIPFITNIVFSSENTGGVSKNGSDGADGEDGKDGKAGGNGGNAISIGSESTVNGTKVVNSVTTLFSSEDSASVSVARTSTSSEVVVQENIQSTSSSASHENTLSILADALFSLQLMFVTYVSLLF